MQTVQAVFKIITSIIYSLICYFNYIGYTVHAFCLSYSTDVYKIRVWFCYCQLMTSTEWLFHCYQLFFPTEMYLNVMCVCDYLCCERMKAGRGRNEHVNCSRTLINPRSLHTSGLWGPPHGHWLLGNICFRDSRLSAKQVCSKS